MINPAFAVDLKKRENCLTKMRHRAWSWHKDNSSVLPLKRRNDEEYERTQLLVVWTEEREIIKKRGDGKLGFAFLSVSFFFFF